MQIEFIVPIVTEGKPSKTKDPKTILASVKRIVDVKEFTAAEAPVAVTCWFEAEDRDGEEIGFREYREIDGRLYIDLAPEILRNDIRSMGTLHHEVAELPCLPPFHLVGQHIMNYLRALPHGDRKARIYPGDQAALFARSSYVSGPFTDMSSLKLETYDEGMVSRCIALFDEGVAGIVLVDGHLHSLERTPIIQVDHWFANTGVKAVRRPMPGTIIRYDDQDGGQNTPIKFFQIDQIEEAMEFASTAGGSPQGQIKVQNEVDVVVVPDAPIDFDAASAMVYAVAVAIDDRIVDFFGRQGGRYAIDLMSAVMGPYRILERELQNGQEENVSDDLVQAVEQVLDMGEEIVEHFVGTENVGAIRRVLDEWHDRPMSLNIGPKLGM